MPAKPPLPTGKPPGIRHPVDDFVECSHGIVHLVVLSGDEGAVGVGAVAVAGEAVACPCAVGQRTALAHFLEYYGVHRAAEVIVIELSQRFVELAVHFVFVGEHAHVQLLGRVGSHVYYGFFRLGEFIAVHALYFLQLGRSAVQGVDVVDYIFAAVFAVVYGAVLLVVERGYGLGVVRWLILPGVPRLMRRFWGCVRRRTCRRSGPRSWSSGLTLH